MNPFIMIMLLFFHFIGDFPLQTELIATNKSKAVLPLLKHCILYSLLFFVMGFYFWLIILITHIIIDYISSRINLKLYHSNKRMFFVNLGLDQFIHTTILILAYYYLYV